MFLPRVLASRKRTAERHEKAEGSPRKEEQLRELHGCDGGAESCSPSLPYSRAKEWKAWRPNSSVSFQMKSAGLRLEVVVEHRNVDAGDRSVAISPVYVAWHSQQFRTKRRFCASFGCFVLEGAALRIKGMPSFAHILFWPPFNLSSRHRLRLPACVQPRTRMSTLTAASHRTAGKAVSRVFH